MNTTRREDVHVTLTRIPISHIKEVHKEMEERNESLTAMLIDSMIVVPTTKNVITPRLATEMRFNTMPIACASQDKVLIGREDGFFYDWEGIKHCRIGTQGQYTFEQMTSILEYGIQEDCVPFWGLEATVVESTKSLGVEIPHLVDAILTVNIVDTEDLKE